jgi:hypothetical protein
MCHRFQIPLGESLLESCLDLAGSAIKRNLAPISIVVICGPQKYRDTYNFAKIYQVHHVMTEMGSLGNPKKRFYVARGSVASQSVAPDLGP